MTSAEKDTNELTFSEMEDSVLEMMNFYLQQGRAEECANRDIMEIEDDDDVKEDEAGALAVRVTELKALLQSKETIIREYEKELRSLRAKFSQHEEKEEGPDKERLNQETDTSDSTFKYKSRGSEDRNQKKRRKCLFFEKRGFCRFGASCYNIHPKNKCNILLRGGECSSGDECLYLHPHKECRYWQKGFCRRSAED